MCLLQISSLCSFSIHIHTHTLTHIHDEGNDRIDAKISYSLLFVILHAAATATFAAAAACRCDVPLHCSKIRLQLFSLTTSFFFSRVVDEQQLVFTLTIEWKSNGKRKTQQYKLLNVERKKKNGISKLMAFVVDDGWWVSSLSVAAC